jgi:post-segregation antitoxin (ccd killing protein)
MKRTNVILDEELLERARRVTGEKTYSATITKALEKVVRQDEFWKAYKEWEAIAQTEGVFEPDYVKEKLAKSDRTQPQKRMPAHAKRVARTKSKRRVPR